MILRRLGISGLRPLVLDKLSNHSIVCNKCHNQSGQNPKKNNSCQGVILGKLMEQLKGIGEEPIQASKKDGTGDHGNHKYDLAEDEAGRS